MSDRHVARATSRPVTAFLAAALCLAALAGCNNDPDDSSSPDEPSATPTEATASSAPTEPVETETTPTEAESTSTPPDDNPSDSDPARAKQAQIPARQLPGFNPEWKWTKRSSGPGPGQDVPSVCMQSSLTAIGGVAEYRTDFDSPLDDSSWAVQETVVFPDEQTAITSESVLDAWQKKCARYAKSAGLKDVKVTRLSEVSTATGPGQQWLVMYGPVPGDPDASWMQAEGYVRDGDTMTYLVMTTAGQDYNYESGQEPVAQGLQVAAERLLATR